MTRSIKDVIVDRISLVSKDNTPAVPKAESKFSIFKMVWVFNGDSKLKKDIENKIDETIRKLKKW